MVCAQEQQRRGLGESSSSFESSFRTERLRPTCPRLPGNSETGQHLFATHPHKLRYHSLRATGSPQDYLTPIGCSMGSILSFSAAGITPE